MRLILLRHGRTGLSGRYVGSSDVPLSEEGRGQICDLRSSLGTIKIDGLLVSPMLRCTESARLLELGLPMQLDPDLREIDFGRWEGKTFAEIEAQDQDLVQHWASGAGDFCFPGGEAIAGFARRVDAVKNRLLVSADAKTMLLVTHGGVIRSLICGLLGLSQKDYLLFQVAKGHYSTIDLYDGGGVLTGFNLGSRG